MKDFLLPDLGEGLTEGEIVRWLVSVGDTITEDQPVAEIETAKAVVEVPSPYAGVVARLHAKPGEEVAVGRPLLTVDDSAADPAPSPPAGHDRTRDQEESGSVLVGYGTSGRARRRRRSEAGRSDGEHEATRPLAKPPVRKLAKDLGVELKAVSGSGPGGVVTREDVREFHAARVPEPATEAEPARAETPAAGDGDVERVPVRGIRKRIAEKMTVSRLEIPEAACWIDCDATELMRLREQIDAAHDGVRITPLAIVLRACVAALRDHPNLNASFDGQAGEIVRARHIHLGVATQTERGLLVPVIRHAQRRSLLDIASAVEDLAAGARQGTLAPEQLTGSTFTVSNYGSFGVDGGIPVINHPEAAILGLGRVRERPWVHEASLAIRRVVQLSLTFDHRVCDGAEAGRFLRLLADCIEQPAALIATL